jgi:N-glycosidase YbiA
MAIYFYSTREVPYGCFSNFSAHGFELDGHYWRTSEHYFQACKFVGHPDYDELCALPTPKAVAKAGRERTRPLRPDWEEVKDDIMRVAVRQKFATHASIRDLLLATGDEELVENTTGDYYWGCGKNGTGKNMLGKILMEVRAEYLNLGDVSTP